MPRNMSFMHTTPQMYRKTKTVTRRMGWNHIKAGDIINAVEQCQGLNKGAKMQRICQIRILNSRWVQLNRITKQDVVREGFPNMTPKEFIDMFCTINRCDRFASVNRIEFEYV